MSEDFHIPLCMEELMQGPCRIRELLSPTDITCKIDECQSLFAEAGPSSIDECFHVIYSVMHHFSALSQTVRISFWNMTVEALVDSCQFFDSTKISNQTKQNSLKMLVYSVAQFVDLFENLASNSNSINTVKQGRKTKKSASSTASSLSDTLWEEERERVIVLLHQLHQQNLSFIFEPPACDGLEDIIRLSSGCCYKMLENPTAVKNIELKNTIASLLGLIVKSYHQNLSVSVKMVQLLQHFDHLVQPLASILQLMVTKYNLNTFVCDVIREIGEKDPQDLSLDTSGTKSYSSFINEMARTLPVQTKECVTYLKPHLNGESQTMRNGVLCAFGEIISQTLSDPDNMEDDDRGLRDTLLDNLQQHIHDISAFVRCKAVQIWLQLCEAKCIPLTRLNNLLLLICGRLCDKSTLVRKSTLQFLSALLKNNPFAANLDLDHCKQLLSIETETLRALLHSQEAKDIANRLDTNHEDSVLEENQLKLDSENGGEENGGSGKETDGGEEENGRSGEETGRSGEETGRSGEDQDRHKFQVVKQMGKVQYFKDLVNFVEQIISSIPLATQLLGSKVSSDVHEGLEFLATAQEFHLPGAKDGVRKAILLMSSSEQAIRDLVLNTYVRLFFSPSENHSQTICRNMLSLIHGADIGELASLEKILFSLMKAKTLPKTLVGIFWDIVAGKVPWAQPKDVEYSLLILSMMAKSDKNIVQQNLSLLIEYGLQSTNLILARYSCHALQCLADRTTSNGLSSVHTLLSKLQEIVVSSVSNYQTSQWIPFAQQAITTIYKLADKPNAIVEEILTVISDKVLMCAMEDSECPADGTQGADMSQLLLARLITLAGNVAFQQMVFLESDVKNELKRRRQTEETTKELPNEREEASSIEDELGLAGAAADDMEAEIIRKVCSEEICQSGMLGSVLPVIIAVLSKPKQYQSAQLQTSAALSLSKYMIVSYKVCEEYLRLFFTLLKMSSIATVRSNSLIALGDLIVRFPNLIEPWTKNIYERLGDSDPGVRQSAVTVLTHLILNDMVKVKGQLSEMALCLEDPISKITNRVKLFFLELSKKGNALYNILPDIISRLSDPTNNVTKEKFRNIMSYLFSLIQKDKQCEGLIEKLCHRFRASRTELQGQNLAFCLAQLSFSERGLRKLHENMNCYQSMLTDTDIYNSFLSIVGKLKKFAKPEVKAAVEEFEFKLKEANQKGRSGDDDEHNRSGTTDQTEQQQEGTPPPRNTTNNSITQYDVLVTPVPCKPTIGRSTAKRKTLPRRPLADHNPSLNVDTDDFTLNVISSARRSKQKIKNVTMTAEECGDNPSVSSSVRRSNRKTTRKRFH